MNETTSDLGFSLSFFLKSKAKQTAMKTKISTFEETTNSKTRERVSVKTGVSDIKEQGEHLNCEKAQHTQPEQPLLGIKLNNRDHPEEINK